MRARAEEFRPASQPPPTTPVIERCAPILPPLPAFDPLGRLSILPPSMPEPGSWTLEANEEGTNFGDSNEEARDDFEWQFNNTLDLMRYPSQIATTSSTVVMHRKQPNNKKSQRNNKSKIRSNVKGGSRKIVNQNMNGWKKAEDVEETIDIMIEHNIGAYCIQETWDEDYPAREIRGHLILHHNYDSSEGRAKIAKLTKGRGMRGVTIVLSPEFKLAYEAAGCPKPITTSKKSEHVGRFIGITLQFPKVSPTGKKLKGELTVFLASIYHPSVEKESDEFTPICQALLEKAPKDAMTVIGHDINASIGIGQTSDIDQDLDVHQSRPVGIHGLDNRNAQGEKAVQFMIQARQLHHSLLKLTQRRAANARYILGVNGGIQTNT